MRFVFLSFLLMFSTSLSYAQVREMSFDPKSAQFALYWNTVLNVQSYSTTDLSVGSVFGPESSKVLETQDSIYFVLNRNNYTLWMPEFNIVFKVEPFYNKAIPLGDHLISLIVILRDWRHVYKRKHNDLVQNH